MEESGAITSGTGRRRCARFCTRALALLVWLALALAAPGVPLATETTQGGNIMRAEGLKPGTQAVGNAMNDMKEERGAPGAAASRLERGLALLERIDGHGGAAVVRALDGIAPDFAHYLLEFPFGDIYSRPGLDLKSREIATVAALTAMGTAGPQLRVHIAAALRVGCSRREITEILMQMAVYAGFPAALNGLFAAKEVFAAQDSGQDTTGGDADVVKGRQ